MHEYFVELRICGKDLDPAIITDGLGLVPTTVRKVGDIVGTKRFEQATWGYNGSESDTPPTWKSLEEGLSFVLDKLDPVRPKLEEYKKSYKMIWWCGHFHSGFDGGPTLSPSMLKRLGDFGVPLFVDTYLSEESSAIEAVHQ